VIEFDQADLGVDRRTGTTQAFFEDEDGGEESGEQATEQHRGEGRCPLEQTVPAGWIGRVGDRGVGVRGRRLVRQLTALLSLSREPASRRIICHSVGVLSVVEAMTVRRAPVAADASDTR
jgi:hypothetical protein